MNSEHLSAIETLADLRARRYTACELLDATLARVDDIAQAINPFGRELRAYARKAAKRADRLLARGEGGALCGLPITIKDSHWLKGHGCANGSRTLADFVPDGTSAAVRRLEDAGAVIFAKTTCPEFSMVGITDSPLYGLTRNPRNLDRTPGGSSGGAAAAIAAGLGTLSLGGDGGGSIRIPAAFCGVVGFKPTFARVPREPCFAGWESLVAYGPLARSVADARLMYGVMADDQNTASEAAADPGNLRGLRIIVSEDLGFAPLDDDTRRHFRDIVDKLGRAGAHLVFDQPHSHSSVETWAVIAYMDSVREHRADLRKKNGLGQVTRDILEFGKQFDDADLARAQSRRREIAESYERLFARAGTNLLLTPTLGCEAFGHGRLWPERIGDTPIELPWVDWVGLLYDANLIGLPACAIPMALGNDNLPLSLQIQGSKGGDRAVLDAAQRIEHLLDWHHERLDPRITDATP